MKKWKNLTAPDDPTTWRDMSCMWPTRHGSYEVSDFYGTAVDKDAAGESGSTGLSAWCFNTLTGQRSYVLGDKPWEYAAGALTDRSGGVINLSGTLPMMCQYGNISICTRGTGASLITSTGGNFTALAGAPSADIICVQSNAVVAFNTGTSSDEWVASDVGDYTNWTTGESASGRILDGNGPITAAVPFGNDIIVFKSDRIFRMTYVGGTIKWQIQKIVEGVGCPTTTAGKSAAVACGSAGIFFLGAGEDYLNAGEQYFMFDGVSMPRCLNPQTKLATATTIDGIPIYHPEMRMVVVLDMNFTDGMRPYFYNLETDAWGRGATIAITPARPLFVRGDHSAIVTHYSSASPLRPAWVGGKNGGGAGMRLYTAVAPGGSVASPILPAPPYITSHYYGRPDRKTRWSRLYPLLRRKTNASTGSPLNNLGVLAYRERHSTSTSQTPTATLEADRFRFSFLVVDNFCQFRLGIYDMDAEVDDYVIESEDAGAN